MAKKTITTTPQKFSLSSSWKCAFGYDNKTHEWKWSISEGPSTATKSVTFSFSLPSGAKVKSAKVLAKTGSPYTGISFVRINGSAFNMSGTERAANVSVASGSSSLTVTFSFKANGKVHTDSNTHYSALSFDNVRLSITYEGGAADEDDPAAGGGKKKDNDYYPIPPQSVGIIDGSDLYCFDGVTKIQHTLSLKIEEEPSKKKEQFVNNARNEPDKLAIDVVMSDVHSGAGTFERYVNKNGKQTKEVKKALKYVNKEFSDSRSAVAVAVLHDLKEARKKLTVVTPQYTYVDMLLASITISQDDSCPYGWQGQITFQECYEETTKKNDNSSNPQGKDEGKRTPSWLFTTFGKIF